MKQSAIFEMFDSGAYSVSALSQDSREGPCYGLNNIHVGIRVYRVTDQDSG